MFISSRIYRYIQELLYVITIIGILVAIAIPSYLSYKTKAHIISIVGVFNTIRTDSQIYYALNGEWPEDISPEVKAKFADRYSEVEVEYDVVTQNGAAGFTFKGIEKKISGKTITMRPVIQDDDPFGPVHWVCGDKHGEAGWKIFGVDRTDIGDWYIPDTLK